MFIRFCKPTTVERRICFAFKKHFAQCRFPDCLGPVIVTTGYWPAYDSVLAAISLGIIQAPDIIFVLFLRVFQAMHKNITNIFRMFKKMLQIGN